MAQPLQWYDENADNAPWIKALAELRQRATREGYCYQHVQAIDCRVAHSRRIIASRLANGLSTSNLTQALRDLGTGGS
ncbi:hypothetical protein ACF1BQ_035475 [Bradyrhizobium sp. RDT10]